ncbi:MAG: GGDEF domain-containing protein [Anaerovoracaceae bacterium]
MGQIKFNRFNSLKLANKFRILTAVTISIITIIVVIAFLWLMQNLVENVSKDYAKLYAGNSVKTISTYLNSDISLMRKTANSKAIKEWFKDENNPNKKLDAYNEMQESMRASRNKNFYIGIDKTLSEISVDQAMTVDEIQPMAVLNPNLPKDDWYFEIVESNEEYILQVDIDKILGRKSLWLNYKVVDNGKVIGSLATALELSGMVDNIFSSYSKEDVRGLVVDGEGNIQVDSHLKDKENLFVSMNSTKKISEFLDDPEFKSTADKYAKEHKGKNKVDSIVEVVKLSSGKYSYATFAPIENTRWSVVTFFDSNALFKIGQLIPLFVIIFISLIIFMIVLTRAVSVLILRPFKQLAASMERVNRNLNEQIDCTNKKDEIGTLARSIQKMKDNLIDALGKSNFDGLTGIYNRRYLDENLDETIKKLAKSKRIISLIMVDIDCFKKYNDTYGHIKGDEALKTVAKILLSATCENEGFVARYGGEEFLIILPDSGQSEAILIAERILEDMKAVNIPHGSCKVQEYITVSIGIASSIAKVNTSFTEYINCADEALYESKNNGKNKYTAKTL